MSDAPRTNRIRPAQRTPWSWLASGTEAIGRGLAFCGLALAGLLPLLGVAVIVVYGLVALHGFSGSLGAVPRSTGPLGSVVPHVPGGPPDGQLAANRQSLLGIGVLAACLLPATRWLARLTRILAGRWCGVPIADPYRPRPVVSQPGFWPLAASRAGWVVADPATWRDLLWLAADGLGGVLLVAAPAAMVAYGFGVMLASELGAPVTFLGHAAAWLAVPAGLAMTAAGLWAAPRLLPVYGRLARSMLCPTREAELRLRVQQLAQSRSETVDTGAAEMRRIERDLHDGAQARLVAMGMTLDAAGQLLESDPAAARALLAEARDSSVKALRELRDLVRGIHPPVLADRGLAEAVRALALDLPLPVHVASELGGRAPAPVESAAYFAVSELLANVSKHAGATHAWVDLRYSAGTLRISVTDNGCGGADPARGTGLRGIERRLTAFDGVLAVSSPLGGPTVVNMEIPCALSLPKTSSC